MHEEYPEQLCELTSASQEIWVASMETATSTAENEKMCECLYMHHEILAGNFQLPPVVNEEGSLNNRKCQRKE